VAPDSVWEIVFLMVILKIPIVYLSMVIDYAVKAEPKPEEGAAVAVGLGDDSGPGGRRRTRRHGPRRVGPHGRPTRSIPRTARAAATAARSDRR
jgi:hypothetical protein